MRYWKFTLLTSSISQREMMFFEYRHRRLPAFCVLCNYLLAIEYTSSFSQTSVACERKTFFKSSIVDELLWCLWAFTFHDCRNQNLRNSVSSNRFAYYSLIRPFNRLDPSPFALLHLFRCGFWGANLNFKKIHNLISAFKIRLFYNLINVVYVRPKMAWIEGKIFHLLLG